MKKTYIIKYQTKAGIGSYRTKAENVNEAFALLRILLKDARVKEFKSIQYVAFT